MKVPAIALKTFEELCSRPEFLVISDFILRKLKKIPNPIKRAKYIHKMIDEYNEEIFAHPLVKELTPCKLGCTACCHTQVSVTEDEASLLAKKILGGVTIDEDRLNKQALVSHITNEFYQLSYEDRKCVFLDDMGGCRVYADRPAVCRTNAVLGDAKQCETSQGQQQLRLVKTSKSDMVIYAFYRYSKKNGSLPQMVSEQLQSERDRQQSLIKELG
jgi:Fe-S-cluster containining protein